MSIITYNKAENITYILNKMYRTFFDDENDDVPVT